MLEAQNLETTWNVMNILLQEFFFSLSEKKQKWRGAENLDI